MTSKLSREELEAVISTYGKAHVANRMAVELLAAMDSDPVAWMHNNNDIGIPAITVSQKIGHYWMAEFENVQPLYRHAQQPVVNYVPLGDSPYDVPYSMPSNLREFIDQEIGILFSDDDAQGVWIACRRAAMLAAASQEVKP